MPFTVLMPPITMGEFFQKFVVAIFEKRRGVLVRICGRFEPFAAANPTKKHGRVFTATQRCLQIAGEDLHSDYHKILSYTPAGATRPKG